MMSVQKSYKQFRHSVAIVVGINDYPDRPLQTATEDASAIASLLEQKHQYTKVHLLSDAKATKEGLLQTIETLSQSIDKQDRVIFYFAGHGEQVRGEDGPIGHICLYDVPLPMKALHDALLTLKCSHFLCILDCCFAGAFRWSSTRAVVSKKQPPLYQEQYARFIKDAAWQVITSASYDQEAHDALLPTRKSRNRGQANDHSPFAAALLRALEGKADTNPATEAGIIGDGVITASELYVYLRDEVERATENIQRQTAGIDILSKHDKGEFIFDTPNHPLNLAKADKLSEETNPYRGLSAFEKEDAELFFGRSELTEKLYRVVSRLPLTVVLGPSGSGKSSLVKAGLIPHIEQLNGSELWEVLPIVRPGKNPLRSLETAFAESNLAIAPAHSLPSTNSSISSSSASHSQEAIANSITRWKKRNPKAKLLLFVDQSEEIITLCSIEEEAKAAQKLFLQQILTALQRHKKHFRVVLSLRSDFEPQLRQIGLKSINEDATNDIEIWNRLWQSGRFIVPAMTRSELREAIEKPAAKQVMFFNPHSLVESLVDEVAEMPGSLPLLSFTLSRLYLKYIERQSKARSEGQIVERAITKADYQNVGGIGGVVQSLTESADKEYDQLVDDNPAYERIARDVMLRMVVLSSGEVARRQVPHTELEYAGEDNHRVDKFIKCFRKARLFVEGQDIEGNSYVEPAHDALVCGWGKLKDWIDSTEDLTLRPRLTQAAKEWNKKRHARYLWNASPYLPSLKKKLLAPSNWFNRIEQEFVERSVQRKRFNTRLYQGITLGVVTGLSALSAWALYGQRQAVISQIAAERQAAESALDANRFTVETLGRGLQAASLYDDWLMRWFPTEPQLEAETTATLMQSYFLNREISRWQVDIGETIVDAFIGAENMLAIVRTDAVNKPNDACIRSLTPEIEEMVSVSVVAGEVVEEIIETSVVEIPCEEMPSEAGGLDSAKFSPDGKKIVFISGDRTKLYVWDRTGQKILMELKLSSPVRKLSFSPDSLSIAYIQAERSRASLHQVRWKENRGSITTYKSSIPLNDKTIDFGYRNDGALVLITQESNESSTTFKFWTRDKSKWRKFSESLTVDTPTNGASIAFSKDASQLATSENDGTVRIYRTGNATRSQPIEIKAHQGLVSNLTFSSDGKQLLSAGNDGSIRQWDVSRGVDIEQLTLEQTLENPVQTLAFSPDSQQIATLEEGVVRLRAVGETNRIDKEFPQHQFHEESRLVFHPERQQLAIASPASEGVTIALLDLISGELETLETINSGLSAMAFSDPDASFRNPDAPLPDPNTLQLLIGEHSPEAENFTLSRSPLTIGEGRSLINPLTQLSKKLVWSAVNGTGERLLVAAYDSSSNSIEVWDAGADEQLAAYTVDETLANSNAYEKFSFSHQGDLLTAQYGTLTQIWDWQADRSIFINHESSLAENSRTERREDSRKGTRDASQRRFSQISPDGSTLAFVDDEGYARIYYFGDRAALLDAGCRQFYDYLAIASITVPDDAIASGTVCSF